MNKLTIFKLTLCLGVIALGHLGFYLYYVDIQPAKSLDLGRWLAFLTRLGFVQFIYVLPCVLVLMRQRESICLKWVFMASGATLAIAVIANIATSFVIAAGR